MKYQNLQNLINLLLGIVTLLSGIIAGIWAYTKFIVERGLLPPVEFDVECKKVGVTHERLLIDINLHLKNIGTTTLVARYIFLDIHYLRSSDKTLELFSVKNKIGRINFPHSLMEDLNAKSEDLLPQFSKFKKHRKPPLKIRGLPFLYYDTFVRPSIDQVYSYNTLLPEDTVCVLIWSSFEYAQSASLLQQFVLWISRHIGLIQYSLKHVNKPHTIERIFWLSDVNEDKKKGV